MHPDPFFDGFSHHTSSKKDWYDLPNLHTMEPLRHLHWSKMLTPWTVHDTICNLCGGTLLRRPPLAAIAHDSPAYLETVTAPSLHIPHQTNGIMPGAVKRQKTHVAHHHKEGLSATQGNGCALAVVQETQRKAHVVLNFWLLRKQGAASSESDCPILWHFFQQIHQQTSWAQPKKLQQS